MRNLHTNKQKIIIYIYILGLVSLRKCVIWICNEQMHHYILVTLNMLIPLCKTTDFLQLDPLIEASVSWHSEIYQPSVWSLILSMKGIHMQDPEIMINHWIYKDLYTAGTRMH